MKKKLYRKVNTKARGVHHNFGGKYKHFRNRKCNNAKMRRDIKRGLDYTPLFMFLLSKIGEDWNDIYSEAKSRLDKEEPIFWMVYPIYDRSKSIVRIGESSFYNGLYIDENNILKKINPKISRNDIKVECDCCTYTFNGKIIKRKE